MYHILPRPFVSLLADRAMPVHTRLACLLTGILPILYLAGNAPAEIAAVLVGLLFLFESWRNSDWRWLRQGWVVLALVLWGYMVARGLLAERPELAMRRALPWIRFPLFAVAAACWTLRFPAVRRELLIALILTVAFLIGDTFLQYGFGYDVFGRARFPSDDGGWRLTGPFSAPRVGIVLAWLSPPVLAVLAGKALSHSSRRHVLVAVIFALSFLLAVFLSGERMALLLALFTFVLLALLLKPLRRYVPLLALGALLLLGLFAQYNPSLMARQYFSTLRTVSHWQESAYGQIWLSSARIFVDYPLFGVGTRHFREYCPNEAYGSAANIETRCNLHPHHLYLEWLVENGLIGCILFMAMMGAMLTPVLRQYRICARYPLYHGLLIALTLRLWPLSTATSFFVGWSALPFWLPAGWLLALALEKQKDAEI